MSNPWIEHIRKYAKENGLTYMCGISEASKTYKKSKDDKLKSTPKRHRKHHQKKKRNKTKTWKTNWMN